MVEQLNLFGERSPAAIVAEWLEDWHDALVKRRLIRPEHCGFELSDYVLNEFSHYSGGTAHGVLKEAGYDWYNFSPKGCELTSGVHFGDDAKKTFIKKAEILKIFGFRDDKKDVLKNEKEK